MFCDEKVFCLSSSVNASDFFSIKFKKLLATDIDVHFMGVSFVQLNHFIQLSYHVENASHLVLNIF